MILGLATALAALPACPAPTGEHIVTLGIAAHGHSFGGLGVVDFAGEDWSLTALSPAGPALFTVTHTDGVTTVNSAFPEWSSVLGQLPFARDLVLLHTVTSTSCAVGGSRILVRPDRRLWRGAPGTARVQEAGGKAVLTDPLRGYTLTIVEAPANEAAP